MKILFSIKQFRDAQQRQLQYWIWSVGLVAGILFSIFPAHSQPARSQPTPFYIVADANPNTYGSRWASLIYTEAFKRLGIPFQLDHYTLKRRSVQADDGSVDGEASRVYGYGATHPNLIRVEESVMDFNFALFTANPAVRVQQLEDLRSSANLLVEYRRGILMCENTLKPLVPPERISDVTTEEQGVKKLLAGRTDLYCDIDVFVLQLLHSPEFKNATNVRKVFDLGKSVPTYPYLHRKHAELAPRLAAVLKKMKAEGLIEAYRLQVERDLGWRD